MKTRLQEILDKKRGRIANIARGTGITPKTIAKAGSGEKILDTIAIKIHVYLIENNLITKETTIDNLFEPCQEKK